MKSRVLREVLNKSSKNIYIIAEIGVNHNGDENLAFKLIDLAIKAGADAVKFQMFTPNLLCSGKYRSDEIKMLERYVISLDAVKTLRNYSMDNNLDFIITPFDFVSLKNVLSLNCTAIKVGSGELTHTPFLEEIAKTGSDIIVSTGAANMADVERAVSSIERYNDKTIALLHCTSCYPAPNDSLNLKAIRTLEMAFPQCVVGYSDHSLGLTAANIAVALGAKMIEKHITLDKAMQGPDHAASSDSYEFINMVKSIREAESMLGTGRKVAMECEGTIGRSIVAAVDIEPNTIISGELLDYKRPGCGIRPYVAGQFIGRRLAKAIKKDELISWEHITI